MKSKVTLVLIILALSSVQAANSVDFAGTWTLRKPLPDPCGIKDNKIYTSVSNNELMFVAYAESDVAKCGSSANTELRIKAPIPTEGNTVVFTSGRKTMSFTVVGNSAIIVGGPFESFGTIELYRPGGSSFTVIFLVLIGIAAAGVIFVQKKKADELSKSLASNSKAFLNA